MKLKELQSLLQDVRPFDQPKVELEQYPTGPHLAACMLYTIENSFGDLEGKTVIDLGSGPGMLSIGSALLGASHVLGLELDEDAIEVAMDNMEQFEEPLPVDFIQYNILELLPPSDTVQGTDDGYARLKQQRHKGKQAGGRKGQREGRGGRGGSGRRGGGKGLRRYPGEREEEEEEEENDEEEEEEGSEDEEGEGEGQGDGLQQSEGGQEASAAQQQEPGRSPAPDEPTAPLNASSSSSGTGVEKQPHISWPMPVLGQLRADTVVMNPPFGTKAKGMDMLFLRAAFLMCREGGSVYSLHKSSTRTHIHTVATKQLGAQSAGVVAELRYDLPATMKFHTQKSVDVQVDLWRFVMQ